MKTARTLLFRLIVIQFHKQNTGLFLFLFLLFFGIIPPQHLIMTHAALIQAQLSSAPLMLGVSFFWLLYAGRCIRFMDRSFSEYRHSLLYIYQIIPRHQISQMISGYFFFMFLPVLIYGALVMYIALSQAIFWHLISTVLLLSSILIFSTLTLSKAFLLPKENGQNHWHLPTLVSFRFKQNISLKFMLLAYLWADKKVGLIAQKIFSYLSFNFFFIRNAEIFRGDYFTFFIFMIGAMNALLIFNTHKMMEEKLSFLRNLPITMPSRMIMILITGSVLFIPELIMMLVSGYELLTSAESFILYGILASQFVLMFSILYTSTLTLKKYVQYTFLMLLSYLFLYLLLPTSLIILFNLGLAYLIFHEQYTLYEYKSVTQ